MGYYVKLSASTATLPIDHLDEAMARLCELNTHDEWKRGWSSTGGTVTERYFSWMPADYDVKFTTVEEILTAVGYDVVETNIGGLNVYNYDNKTGCQDLFIWYISDLFEPNSYMEWVGEDGARERWEFGGGEKMKVSYQQGWTMPTDFTPRIRVELAL